MQSTRSLDGHAQTLPCEPPPLALSVDSGLDRMQQLLAAQALLGPAMPSYVPSYGGVVSAFAGHRALGFTGGEYLILHLCLLTHAIADE